MPNTKDNFDKIHFEKSPPLPQAKSIRISFLRDTLVIKIFFTNKL